MLVAPAPCGFVQAEILRERFDASQERLTTGDRAVLERRACRLCLEAIRYASCRPADQRLKGDQVTELSATLPRKWRYGIHPKAVGLQIVALGRVELPIGEALRLEMVKTDPGSEQTVHLQYYISTEAGAWALWLSCPRTDVAALETALQALTPSPI